MNRTFPRWLIWLGTPAICLVWALAARLVWEQTFLTWDRGAQMVGFSLLHSGVGVLLVLAVVGSLAWPVMVLIAAAITRSFGGGKGLLMLGAYGFGWALLSTPYGFWQRLFIDKFSASQAVELLTYAAAKGDLRTVRAFIQAGVPVNAQGRNGTALHAAAVEGELETMDYLLAQGANVNAINPYGNSPMANAVEARARSSEAQSLLERNGGKLIQGTAEQRDRVIDQQVRSDMERFQKDMPK